MKVQVNGQIRFVHADHLRKCTFDMIKSPVHYNVLPDYISKSSVSFTDNNTGIIRSNSDLMKDETISQTPTEVLKKNSFYPRLRKL